MRKTMMMTGGGCVLTVLVALACAAAQQGGADPFAEFTRDWRDDRVWYDGKAEHAVYAASRDIYGQQRTYEASIYTNKEHADPETKTKSSGGSGREVFKHHVRDDIPTENYTYHYSTMCYVGTSDLKSLKIDMGSQEDCGSTFKQFVNHAGTLTWTQFSYFPDEGHRQGTYEPSAKLVYQDALPVVLRGYPFDTPREIAVELVVDQTTTHLSRAEPMDATIEYRGRATLSLPIGEIEAHHVRVTRADGVAHDYWFDAGDERQHVMVQYTGPGGQSYRLKSWRRWAYWER